MIHSATVNSDHVKEQIRRSAETVKSLETIAADILAVADLVADCLRSGGKILTAGNGGSAAEATHMAEELTGRFRGNRPSLPGISLSADGAVLTCIGNDFGFDHVFGRQVEGLGREGDTLVLFSTSGNAANLSNALAAAKAKGVKTVCLLGRDGGALAGKSDCEIIVKGNATERIQEAHQVLVHIILDAVETAYGA